MDSNSAEVDGHKFSVKDYKLWVQSLKIFRIPPLPQGFSIGLWAKFKLPYLFPSNILVPTWMVIEAIDLSVIICHSAFNPWRKSPLRAKAFQPTACLTSICPQTTVKSHPANLGVMYSQHVEFPSRCWLSRPESSLRVNSYSNSRDAGSALMQYIGWKTLLQ